MEQRVNNAKIVLAYLAKENTGEYISFSKLINAVGLDKEELSSCLDTLAEKGLIQNTTISRFNRLIKITTSGINIIGKSEKEEDFQPEVNAERAEKPNHDYENILSAYLKGGRFQNKLSEMYTTLSGSVERHTDYSSISIIFRPEFNNLKLKNRLQEDTYTFEKVTEEIYSLKQLVLLGAPGGGKSATLHILAEDLAKSILLDLSPNFPAFPVPILVELKEWTDSSDSLLDFLKKEILELENILEDLLNRGQIALLLDGLNEIQVQLRKNKTKKISEFLKKYPNQFCVITCRYHDYNDDLEVNKIILSPFDAFQIYDFLKKRLSVQVAKKLFWTIGGGDKIQQLWSKWEEVGADFNSFWFSNSMPTEVYKITSKHDDQLWRSMVNDEHNLMKMLRNPYMLQMLTLLIISNQSINIPNNRSNLFRDFIETLLIRENLGKIPVPNIPGNKAILTAEGQELVAGLKKLAMAMQSEPLQVKGAKGGRIAISRKTGETIISHKVIQLGQRSSILINDEDTIGFVHQLLQEYFLADFMKDQIELNVFDAKKIMDNACWWERTNWEEAMILLTGMFEEDATPILNHIKDINPLMTAYCVKYSGAKTPASTLVDLQQRWLPRVNDTKKEAHVLGRDAVARALSLLNLDNRVMVPENKVLDITWVFIPVAEKYSITSFYISKYLITNQQFQAFIEDGGYEESKWWEGLAEREYAPVLPRFDQNNYPRDSVSWYSAVAFCNWLSSKLGYTVRLPFELEWEYAAKGEHNYIYPYGDFFDPNKANVENTGIGHSTAVGVFPEGASDFGVEDLSGNLWEWCLDIYNPKLQSSKNASMRASRVVKGGSFLDPNILATISSRKPNVPHACNPYQGFRVVTQKQKTEL